MNEMNSKIKLVLLSAVLVMLTLLAGCVAAQPGADASSHSAAAQPDSGQTEVTVPQAYTAVINLYHTAFSEHWGGQQLMDAGLSVMLLDCCSDPFEEIGYAVRDIDGDGVPELAVGSLTDDEFYGKMIFELYTLDDSGNAKLLFAGIERNRWYYAGGIYFANLGASAFDSTFVTTLKLEDREMVDMTFTTDPSEYVQMELTPFSQWQ